VAREPPTMRVHRRACVLLTGVVVLVVYHVAVRPWHRFWGTTAEERRRRLPGDEFVADPTAETTRAITIRAPVEAVWPWIVQLGQGRGGMYSYTRLENRIGAEMHNADDVLPEYQTVAVGDEIRTYPGDSLVERVWPSMHAVPVSTVVLLERGRTLVLQGFDGGTWTFHLDPLDAETTRFVVRSRTPRGASLPVTLFRHLVYEFPHFVMERGMMRGIRSRAERHAG